MSSYDVTITDDEYDAYDNHNQTDFQDGNNIVVQNNSGAGNRRSAALIIPAFPGLQGATIDTATADIYVYNASFQNINLTIRAEDVDDADDLSTTPDVIDRLSNVVSSSVSWVASSVGVGWETSVDFASVLQDVVNRPGFSANNDICVLFEAGNSGTDTVKFRAANNASNNPTFNITYTDPSGVTGLLTLLGVG